MFDRQTLDEIVDGIVEVAHPERIILFGSAARGHMGPHGDIDPLVIKDGANPSLLQRNEATNTRHTRS